MKETELKDVEIHLKKPLVAIVAPSTKLLIDLADTKRALEFFEVLNETTIVAANRSPKKTLRFIEQTESKGVDVIVGSRKWFSSFTRNDSIVYYYSRNRCSFA